MSNELVSPATQDVLVEDHTPLTSLPEAQRLMSDALNHLRAGWDPEQGAQRKLSALERRDAWKVLGFESWNDCLAAGLSDTFGLKIEQAQRIPLVAQLRMKDLPNGEISRITAVASATTTRDLQNARMVGLLPQKQPATRDDNGRRPRPHSTGARKQSRRPDLYKSWRNRVDDLSRLTRSIEGLRADDRYRTRLNDLADTRAEIAAAHAALGRVLADLSTPQET